MAHSTSSFNFKILEKDEDLGVTVVKCKGLDAKVTISHQDGWIYPNTDQHDRALETLSLMLPGRNFGEAKITMVTIQHKQQAPAEVMCFSDSGWTLVPSPWMEDESTLEWLRTESGREELCSILLTVLGASG